MLAGWTIARYRSVRARKSHRDFQVQSVASLARTNPGIADVACRLTIDECNNARDKRRSIHEVGVPVRNSIADIAYDSCRRIDWQDESKFSEEVRRGSVISQKGNHREGSDPTITRARSRFPLSRESRPEKRTRSLPELKQRYETCLTCPLGCTQG